MSIENIVAIIVAQPEHADSVAQALEEAVHAVRKESGCEQYDLHRDRANPNRFIMIERWRDDEAVRAHGTGEALRTLGAALGSRATLDVIRLDPVA